MNAPPPSKLVGAFLARALVGDSREAVDLTLDLLDAGYPEETVITDLLAAAQRQVGERWHANELSVGDEHVATGAAASALHALASAAAAPDGLCRVVVACAEGDWHSLAAQMFAEQLRSHGVSVAYLGASTPAEHVGRFLELHPPDALAVSCNLPLFYGGLARLADAAHEFGVPTIAGGRSLLDGPERARLLGADGWADNTTDAVAIIKGWREQRPSVPSEATALLPAAVELDAVAAQLASVAFHDLAGRFPAMASYDTQQLARTREDLGFIVQFIAAAMLVDDDEVLTDFLDWLTQLLDARHVPRAAVVAGLESLRPLLDEADPAAGRLALTGLRHLASLPPPVASAPARR